MSITSYQSFQHVARRRFLGHCNSLSCSLIRLFYISHDLPHYDQRKPATHAWPYSTTRTQSCLSDKGRMLASLSLCIIEEDDKRNGQIHLHEASWASFTRLLKRDLAGVYKGKVTCTFLLAACIVQNYFLTTEKKRKHSLYPGNNYSIR